MDSGFTPFFDRLDEYRNTPKTPSDWHIPDPDESDETVASPAEMEENANELRSAYSRVGLGLFLYALVPQVLVFGFAYLAEYLFPELLAEAWFQLIVGDAFMYLIGAPICLLAMGMPKRTSAVRREKLPFFVFLMAICIFETASIVGSWLGNGLMGLFSLLVGHDYSSALDTMIDGLSLPMIFIFVVVIGPIMEEIIFRYAPLKRLLPYGEFRAVLMSAIIFGLAHGNLYQFFYCVAGGMVLGYLFSRTRNILYPILLHMLFNFFGGFVPVLIERMAASNEILETVFLLLHLIFICGLALVGIILLCLFFRQIKFRPAELALPEKGLFKRTWLNGGMIALTVTSFLLLLLSFIPT